MLLLAAVCGLWLEDRRGLDWHNFPGSQGFTWGNRLPTIVFAEPVAGPLKSLLKDLGKREVGYRGG